MQPWTFFDTQSQPDLEKLPVLKPFTSVYPQTVNVSNTVDVLIQLKGDGWALQPNPIDVVLCNDDPGVCFTIILMVSLMIEWSMQLVRQNFNSQMSAIRDRVGLVSFGDNSATSGWANLIQGIIIPHITQMEMDWSGVYSNGIG